MNVRWISLALLAAVPSMTGYAQSEPASASETVAGVHWLGKKTIAADTNATALMGVWNLPESAKLENRILDKLSAAPWVLLHRPADTNAAALLRPLLDDMVQQESYLEIRQAGREPGQLLFAIRLADARAALWETNLAATLESLTGIHPASPSEKNHGWSLKKHHVPNLIEWTYADGWLVLGAAQDHNAPLVDLLARIRRGRVPFAAKGTNFWLDADLDLRRVASALALDWNLPEQFPRLSLGIARDGTNALTHADFVFPQPLPVEFEPWTIPTNLIHAPITSFVAIRGFRPWLVSADAWDGLRWGAPPNQFFLWSDQGQPMLTYMAVPMADASNRVARISEFLLQKRGSSIPTNDLFGFISATDWNGLEWRGSPFLTPYLKSVFIGAGDFAAVGLFPAAWFGDEPSPDFPWEILNRPDLAAYEWEMTGTRVTDWLYVGQFFRFVMGRSQLPDSAATPWLKAMAPRLGKSVTRISKTGPDRLSLDRKSTLGLDALELHLLADWFESPRFPVGLHTLLSPPVPPPVTEPPP